MANEVDNLKIRINANAGNAAKNIEKLAAALDKLKGSAAVSSLNQLSGSLNKVANSSNTLNKNINSLTKIGNSYNKTVGTMHVKTSSWSNSVFRSAMNIRASFLLIRGAVMIVADTLGDCFKESSEYIENLNLFAVSMGDNYEKAKEYAERVQGALGIDASAWMAYQGKFQNLATGFGVASDKAAVMSQTLTQLTYDLSSFFNVDFDTAFKKLQSGMTGQIKGLKEYGINLSVAALQEYADAHAINVKVRQLTEAERAILRYNLVMERTAKMQGDMARTIVTPANSMRIFANQVTLAKRAIGNLISVVLVKFIPYMQAFVRVIEWVASELAKLFGFELPKIDYSGMGELADATGGVNDAIEDVGDNADKSTKKVKELKKNLLQLMGFDEINILKAPTKDTSASTGVSNGSNANVGGGSLGAFADNIPTYDFLKNLDTKKADELFKKFKKIGQKVIDIVKWTIKWWDVIKFIGKLLIGIWAVGKIVKFVKYIKELWAAFKSLAIIRALSKYWNLFLDGFALGSKYLGKNFFSSIGYGLKNVRNSLTGVQKAGITALASIAGFLSFKDLFYNLEKGTLTWGKALLDITIAAVAIGAAFALTGPVGGVIAILGTLAGAVYGVVKASQEMGEEAYKSSLNFAVLNSVAQTAEASYRNMKTAIDTLKQTETNYTSNLGIVDKARSLAKEIFDLNKKTHLNAHEFAVLKTKVEIFNGLGLNGIKLQIDETTGRVKQTRSEVKGLIDDIELSIRKEATRDLAVKAYKAQIESLQSLKDNTKLYAEAQYQAAEAEKKMTEIASKYDKEWGNAVNGAGMLGDALTYLDTDYQKYNAQLKEAKSKMEESNSKIKDSAKNYQEASGKVKGYTKDLTNLSDSAAKSGENIGKGINSGIDKETASILTKLATLGDSTIASFNKSVGIKSPSTKFAKSGINIDQGIIKGVNARKSKVITTISKIGTQAVKAFNKSIKGFKTGGFVKAFNDISKKAKSTFKTSTWSGYVKNAKTALNTFNITSLIKKLSNIYNKAKSVFSKSNWNTFKTSVNKVNTVVFSSLHLKLNNIRTKSKSVFGKSSWNTFKTSVNKVNTAVFSSLHLKMNNIRTKAQTVFNQKTWEGYANQVSKGFDKGLNLPEFELQIGQDTNVKLTKAQKAILKTAGINKDYMPLISWKEYARGGKPINGEYFIARENGAELVGRVGSSNAVMNNDQIVAAVSQGVYNAVVGAMSGMKSGDGGTYNINVYSQIDGRTVGEASIQYHNGQVKQKGASPLIGVAKA